ncbi:MAG: ATP synthase F0 subunit B [Desulfobacterales bacterium]|uniref:ATP synthase subunit b n=1 Tax=Candidatus Desulfatibia profunda TaxID=2841695 RepID=A0A8J6NPE6_9BACT|nr:ATP synthase F0 subunit B [Candidatus Desulfatibia profunda]MBL7179370.1 ATP synthase F0 subunit B [Desulfobacterales bacterium]
MDLLKIKWPEINRKGSVVMVVTVLAFLCFIGMALASSGGEGAAKGWVATDTYRVMNFAVLAIALFFLLRKPTSQALDARIEGIKEQLSELEAKKRDAEKQLAAYNERFATLEKEAERLIADYIRQGNEAKARILVEAQSAAEKLEEQARRNIEHEFKQAKSKLQEEIFEKALAKAEDLIKRKITAQDQEKLVHEYIEKVVA